MKAKLRWIIPLSIAFLLVLFLIGYYNLKPRLLYEYDEKSDTYLVYKAFGNSEEYTIPEKHNDKIVSGIGERAFFKHNKLKEIKFEKKENINIIKKLAFSECVNLEKIDLSMVVTIERNAFSYDEKLNNIELSAKNIGSSAFYKCVSLDNLVINEGVTSIGTFTFSYNTFKEIKLPKSLKNIYDDVFKYCDKLEKVEAYYTLSSQYLSGLKGYSKYYD